MWLDYYVRGKLYPGAIAPDKTYFYFSTEYVFSPKTMREKITKEKRTSRRKNLGDRKNI